MSAETIAPTQAAITPVTVNVTDFKLSVEYPTPTIPSSWVYVLRLSGERYYVGYTEQLTGRLDDHFKGSPQSAAWTRMYKPLDVVLVVKGGDRALESQLTLNYMRKFGWERVRGGQYVRAQLPIPHEFEDKNSCFRCRGPHFVANCPQLPRQGPNQRIVEATIPKREEPPGEDVLTLMWLFVFYVAIKWIAGIRDAAWGAYDRVRFHASAKKNA